MYIMIELRMPPDKLGSAIVIVVTVSVFYSSFSPFIAFYPQPIPYLIGTTIMIIAMVLTFFLPEGG
jgi:hypothetical protein